MQHLIRLCVFVITLLIFVVFHNLKAQAQDEIIRNADKFYPTDLRCPIGSSGKIEMIVFNFQKTKLQINIKIIDKKMHLFEGAVFHSYEKLNTNWTINLIDAEYKNHKSHRAYQISKELFDICNGHQAGRDKHSRDLSENLRRLQKFWRENNS